MTSPGTTQLCRICLRPDPVAPWNLFECTVVGRPVADVLVMVAGGGAIPVPQPGDGLPQVCCSGCLQQLEVAFNLREMIRESHRKLICGGELLEHPVGVSALSGFVECYEVTKLETQSDHLGSSIAVKSEPLDEGAPSDEFPTNKNTKEPLDYEKMISTETAVKLEPRDDDYEVPDGDEDDQMSLDDEEIHIKEELTVEETNLQDVEQPVAKRKKFGKHTTEFLVHFDEVMVQPNECCGCRVVFDSHEELQVHLETEHASKRQVEIRKGLYECPRCFQVIRSEKKHRLRSLHCKICGQACSTYFRATEHYRDCHGPGTSLEQKTCCGCMKKFKSLEELKLHSNETHLRNKLDHDNARPLVCEVCYRNYPNYLGLHRHQTRIQGNVKPHQCNQCDQSFFYFNALKDHQLSHTKDKSFPCTECPKTFCTQKSLRKHQLRHEMPTDKFQCQTCTRSFRSRKALREHGYVHTGERPHKCTLCEASFSRYDCYTVHLQTKHGPKVELHCKVCQKQFGSAYHLTRHERSHEKSPHPCQHCERGFSRKEYLQKHVEKQHPEVENVETSQ